MPLRPVTEEEVSTRGLHSSTFQLTLSHFDTNNTPSTPPQAPRNTPWYLVNIP